jgi:hypothetical protein
MYDSKEYFRNKEIEQKKESSRLSYWNLRKLENIQWIHQNKYKQPSIVQIILHFGAVKNRTATSFFWTGNTAGEAPTVGFY